MRNKESRLAKSIDREFVNSKKLKIRSFKKRKCLNCKHRNSIFCDALEELEYGFKCENYEAM